MAAFRIWLFFLLFCGSFVVGPHGLFLSTAFAKSSDSNDAQASRLVTYLKKHKSVIQQKGEDHYYRQVLWALIAIDFKTLSGPVKRELLSLLFDWIGGSLSENEALEIKEALKKKGLGSELDEFFSPLRLAVLKEVDARDLSRDLRDALKKAFTRLQMDQAGLRRLEIFDRDEERFVNEMLIAGLLPSTVSPEALLGNNLITNLAGNLIGGNFSSGDLVTQAKAVSQALGISEDTTGKLLQAAVNDKLVQNVIGTSKLASVQERLQEVRAGLGSTSVVKPITRVDVGDAPPLAALLDRAAENKKSANAHSSKSTAPKIVLPKKTGHDASSIGLPTSSSRPVGASTPAPKVTPTAAPTAASPPTPTARAVVPDSAPLNEPVVVQSASQGRILQYLGGDYTNVEVDSYSSTPSQSNADRIRNPIPSSPMRADLKKREEESIRQGSNIQGCDVKEKASEELCKYCGPESKPCRCFNNMLRLYNGTDGKSLEESLRDNARAVGRKLEKAILDRTDFLLKKSEKELESKTLTEQQRKTLLEKKEFLVATRGPEKTYDRGFYVSKAFLNGLMLSKTPACVLADESAFSDKEPVKDLEPVMIQGNEEYCHQFDLKPEDDFSKLSKQDEAMLMLFKITMRELAEAREKREKYAERVLGAKGQETIATKSEDTPEESGFLGLRRTSTSKIPPLVSQTKPELKRVFEDESQRSALEKGIPLRTENRIEKTLRDCFGPREWGGMLLRYLETLQPIAAACKDPIAYEMAVKRKHRTNIEALCTVHDRREGWIEDLPANLQDLGSETILSNTVSSNYSSRSELKAAGSKIVKARNEDSYCRGVSEEYKEIFDILKTSIFNNPEVCNKEKLRREYKAKFLEDHYE